MYVWRHNGELSIWDNGENMYTSMRHFWASEGPNNGAHAQARCVRSQTRKWEKSGLSSVACGPVAGDSQRTKKKQSEQNSKSLILHFTFVQVVSGFFVCPSDIGASDACVSRQFCMQLTKLKVKSDGTCLDWKPGSGYLLFSANVFQCVPWILKRSGRICWAAEWNNKKQNTNWCVICLALIWLAQDCLTFLDAGNRLSRQSTSYTIAWLHCHCKERKKRSLWNIMYEWASGQWSLSRVNHSIPAYDYEYGTLVYVRRYELAPNAIVTP